MSRQWPTPEDRAAAVRYADADARTAQELFAAARRYRSRRKHEGPGIWASYRRGATLFARSARRYQRRVSNYIPRSRVHNGGKPRRSRRGA